MVSPFSLSTGNELELRTKLKSLPAEHQGSEATEQPMSVWSKAFFLRLNNETPNPKNRVNTPAEISPRNIPQIFPPQISSVLLGSFTTLKHQCFYSIFSMSTLSDLNILWDWATSALVYETHSGIYEECSHIPHSFNPQPVLWGRWKRTVGIRITPIIGMQDIIVL